MARFEQEQLPPGVPPVTYAPREPRLRRPPFVFIAIGIIAMVASWVPLVLFARGRVQRTTSPRISFVQDMGTQPKFREQQTNELFADGRADRPQVTGTIPRGTEKLSLLEDDHYSRGYVITGPAAAADKPPQVKFFDGFPKQVKVDDDLIRRGQARFNIYCTACHGWDGSGHGPVRERASEIHQEWAVANLTSAGVRARPEGHIFNTITNGFRSMPSYSSQIPVEDRWAILAYVRVLQASQPVAPEPVAPPTQAQAQPQATPAAGAGAPAAVPNIVASQPDPARQQQASR
jgi:mono/diheme cytochrome c family protein